MSGLWISEAELVVAYKHVSTVYLTKASRSIPSNGRMNDESEIIWKEAVVV
jgi:hypothetical protein